jgi:L-serine/L-threonine ammonia-lyase
VQFVASSGGNAGMAVAYAGRQLGVPVTVFVPETTPANVRDLLELEGARVVVAGRVWREAHDAALAMLATQPEAVYIPPFDHPDIWTGHRSLVHELVDQLAALPYGAKPAAVVVAVGGGGLLNGVVEGLRDVGWTDVPVVAMETLGAHSLQAAVLQDRIVPLPAIASVAKTLGASAVSAASLEAVRTHPIHACVVRDAAAVAACVQFARDHRFLVEPACGAALAAVYEHLFTSAQPVTVTAAAQSGAPLLLGHGPVVVLVCGGNLASPEALEQWQRDVRSAADPTLVPGMPPARVFIDTNPAA